MQNAADLTQMGSQLKLTVEELQRARVLTGQGYETRQVLDQRQSQFDVAIAAYHSTEAKIAAATAGVQSATHNADLIQVNIADNTLVAPEDGPIMYRLANVGEVMPAGGKVFTMLDVTYVYMDIFLPTETAGRVKIGDEASIVLDAFPTQPIRATVSFLAARNEFTPKTVETQSERDKLMFRVRVRIDPALLRAYEADVRSGLPGLAYIGLDATPWPAACARHRQMTGNRRARRRTRKRLAQLRQAGRPAGRVDRAAGRRAARPDWPGRGRKIHPARHPGRCKKVQLDPTGTNRVSVFGGDFTRARHRGAVCARIAYMPQSLGRNLYPDLTVRENIAFFSRLFGKDAAERARRTGDLLAATGLASFGDRAARKLSGGMRQKLGLCCALIHDPDLLILDEPTTGVDPLSRRQFWDLVDRIRAGGPAMSVIVATAYMEEAERFGRLVAMNDGAVFATGTPAEIRLRTACDTLDESFIALLPEALRAERIRPDIPPLIERVSEQAISAVGLTRRSTASPPWTMSASATDGARSSASWVRTAAARRRRCGC